VGGPHNFKVFVFKGSRLKKLLVGIAVVLGLWFIIDSGVNEVGKQQYTFD